MPDEFLHDPRIAYFSMEIALRSEIPTYSGGLGVLAGDTLRSAADLDFPMVAMSLVSRAGYFRQGIDADGRQVEAPAPWRPEDWARPLSAKIAVEIERRPVWVGAWLYVVEGQRGGRAPVLLLDTQYAENDPRDREITHTLYGGDDAYRLKQEIVLGIGGTRLLRALGFEIRAYHMNEGHSALLGLEILRRYRYPAHELQSGESPYDLPRVRARCRFTTHTPLDAGHDQFAYELVERLFGDDENDGYVDLPMLKRLAGEDSLNMTRLALNLSEYVNGVAERHAETSRKMYPGYHVHAITNGVHPFTWVAEGFRALYDQYLPGWCHEPERLARAAERIPVEALEAAHESAKRALIARIAAEHGRTFDPERPILGFARRMTAYKRPDLLFSDLDRLRAIAARQPFQIVLAGQAHPRDQRGKELIAELVRAARTLGGAGDAPALYAKLENVVLPLYYGRRQDPSGWRRVMQGAITKNGAYFNTHRMMRRYAAEAYQR